MESLLTFIGMVGTKAGGLNIMIISHMESLLTFTGMVGTRAGGLDIMMMSAHGITSHIHWYGGD